MAEPDSRRPLVSVALSVHNGARFLSEQLDSVLAQRDVVLEVVAVDDASHDGSLALLEERARQDSRLRVYANPVNLGPTASFERAMELCRGEFIAPCDQDDRWDPDKLAVLLAAIGGHDVAYCDSRYIDEQGVPTGRRVSQDLVMLAGRQPLRLAMDNPVSGHAMLLRRDLFEAARPLPPVRYYDWLLALFAAARHGIVYVDRPLVDFRRHPSAFSSTGKTRQRRRRRDPERYRRWLIDRLELLQALAERHVDRDGHAGRLAETLGRAVEGGARGPLLRAVWRARAGLAQGMAACLIRAVHLQWRLLRKLDGARRRPSVRGPLPGRPG